MPYSLDQHEAFIAGIRLGLTQRLAAARARWRLAEVYGWLREAEDAERDGVASPYIGLRDDIDEAEAECAVGALRVIQDGSERAAMWLLERRYPAEYGQIRRVDVHHDGGVEVDVTTLLRDAAAEAPAHALPGVMARLVALGADPDVL